MRRIRAIRLCIPASKLSADYFLYLILPGTSFRGDGILLAQTLVLIYCRVFWKKKKKKNLLMFMLMIIS